MKTNRDKWEYLAGIIDGEGTIGVFKSGFHSGRQQYYSTLQVGNTDRRLIKWLLENFKGNCSMSISKNENAKDSYKWSIKGHKAYKILIEVRDFLLLKQEQADVVIEHYRRVTRHYHGGDKNPRWAIALTEEAYRKTRELNKRGKNE